MSGSGGIYDGPDGIALYGDGREVETLTATRFYADALADLDRKLSEIIPDDISNEALDKYCRQAVDGAEVSSRQYSINLAVLGRSLAVASKRGKPFLDSVGMKSLGDYERSLDPRGGKHGSIYSYKLSCELWPDRTILEIVDAGTSYLVEASRVAKLMPTQAERDEVFEWAQGSDSLTELRSKLENRSGISTRCSSLVLTGSADEIAEIVALCRDLRFKVPGENRKDPNTGVILGALQSFAAEEVPPEDHP